MSTMQLALLFGAALIAIFLLKSRLTATTERQNGVADPLAEAEVYLAYGRKKQALELLEKAFRENPRRNDIREKLRELKK